MRLTFLIVFLISNFMSDAVREQSIAVKGRLLCGSAPAKNTRVKLFDEDTGPDPDDELDAGYTDANGEFKLSGSTVELTNIDVIFKVYHSCDDLIPGDRKIRFKIPASYITNGTVPRKTFDIGILNLETVFAEEERELITSKRKRHLKNMENEPLNLFSHF